MSDARPLHALSDEALAFLAYVDRRNPVPSEETAAALVRAEVQARGWDAPTVEQLAMAYLQRSA